MPGKSVSFGFRIGASPAPPVGAFFMKVDLLCEWVDAYDVLQNVEMPSYRFPVVGSKPSLSTVFSMVNML